MLRSFWKTAWRNITRHPLFALINVLGLALGVCFCLVIFLVVRYEFSFDRFHPGGDRTYLVGRTMRIGNNPDTFNATRVRPNLLGAIRREVTGVEAVAGFFSDWSPSLKVPDAKAKSGYAEFSPPKMLHGRISCWRTPVISPCSNTSGWPGTRRRCSNRSRWCFRPAGRGSISAMFLLAK